MNRVMKNLLIAFFVCIVICGIGIAATYFLRVKGEEPQPVEDFEKEISKSVKSIDIDISNGSIEIVKGEKLTVEAENSLQELFECSVSDGVLKIKQKNEAEIKLFGWYVGTNFRDIGYRNFKLQITVPEDVDFSKLNINLGAGSVYLEDITSDKIVIQTGAGKIKLEGCEAKTSSAFQVGVGKIEAGDVELGSSTIECGTGIVDINLKDSSKKDQVKLISTLCWNKVE